MKLLIDGYVYWVRPEQSLLDIIKEFGLVTGKLSTDPIAAKIAGEVFTLNYIPMRMEDAAHERESIRKAMAASGGKVSLLRYSDPSGKDAYRRTAQFVIFLAMRNLWPERRCKMNFTLGPALLIQVEDAVADGQLLVGDPKKVLYNMIQDILLEINIGNEESKSGFQPEEVLPLVARLGEFPNIRVKGLMAIPPISQKNGDNVKFFQKMCNISVDIIAKKEDNDMAKYLSMGMSDDYPIAVKNGSTLVRVGSRIFGERIY